MMIIQVLQEDIDRGRHQVSRFPGTANSMCPIGQACSRNKLYEVYLNVNKDALQLDDIVYLLPEEARKFVWMFDNEKKVDPLTFEIK